MSFDKDKEVKQHSNFKKKSEKVTTSAAFLKGLIETPVLESGIFSKLFFFVTIYIYFVLILISVTCISNTIMDTFKAEIAIIL